MTLSEPCPGKDWPCLSLVHHWAQRCLDQQSLENLGLNYGTIKALTVRWLWGFFQTLTPRACARHQQNIFRQSFLWFGEKNQSFLILCPDYVIQTFSALLINLEQNEPHVVFRSKHLDVPFRFWALIACDHTLWTCMFVYL